MEGPFAQIALGADRDVIGLGGDRFDRFFADDRGIAIEQHGAGGDEVAFELTMASLGWPVSSR